MTAPLRPSLPSVNDSAAAALWRGRALSYRAPWSAASTTLVPRFANGSLLDHGALWNPHPFNK